jgi:hypothetical protein
VENELKKMIDISTEKKKKIEAANSKPQSTIILGLL